MLNRTGEQADLFQALVENSSDAIALIDGRGVLQYASRSSERVLGYSPEERVNLDVFELVHPDDLPAAREAFADCLVRPGAVITTEFRVRHKDGVWRHVEAIAVNRLAEPPVGGIVVNFRDVSERKRTEQALRASEERLRHLVEHAQDLIYYCDPTGHFTYVNPAACRVMQYSVDELIGRHFMTLIAPAYRDRAGELYARQIVERTPNTYFEFHAITKGGDTIWVGQHVQLVYEGDQIAAVQAIARDITRQKTAEEALRRSEARYRSLIQGAAYGIYRSTLDGRILDANPALATMLGYESVHELMTHNMRELYATAGDRERLIEQYRREGPAMAPAEIEWRRRDGASIIVRLTARIVDFDDGLSCFEGIAEDVTARRALEDRLREAQKMEAVGRLARGIAHDFNNLLAAILGCSDLLVARLDPADPSHADAAEIGKAAERGAALTRQLLAFSRRQTLEPQLVDADAVVKGLDQILRRLAGPSIALRLHTSGMPAPVRMEPAQIEQVLLNLVVNARDAMPEGGNIDVVVDAIDLDTAAAVHYPGLLAGRYTRLTVRDTGHGMDLETQRHVFEPFFTTKDAAKGTGLGLSIVYAIAKDAGGTVVFRTSATGPDRGTTFEVLLPAAA